ncbi:ABC transporter substrate-binding protein [Paenibacillus sp. PAMC21692]|uniref:ABC transporter substrate-binding protein n=1 Tax=Paenibacillus sp. PAMC21692 TaxID=2762320 RepID=UPI0028FCCA8F|nr:ABC transporter substrate-binding protein [Paenibacillus sp. PAMC21692]
MNDKRHGRRNPAIHAILLIMAAVLVLLSGCSVREQQAGGQRGEEQQADEAREAVEGMPIARDRIALTFFTGQSPNNIGPYEDKLVWKKMAERSNMDIDFRLIPFEVLANQRALALAGEELPDAFYSARLSSAELYMYGRKGVLIPLDDYLADHAPNFYALLERYPELRQGLTMPDGHIYSFPSFYDPEFLTMLVGMPFWVNGKWLERLGMQEPVTTDELLAYLRAVRDTDLNGNGVQDEIPVASVGITPLLDQLKGAFGLGNRGIAHRFVDVDKETGELRFLKADPAYRELLAFANGLKEEGLLARDIFSLKETALNALGQAGLLGAAVVPNPATVMGRDEFIGLGALQGPRGDRLYSHIKPPLIHTGAFAVTKSNPYPEETIRWMDYFFGEEGATLFFMGEEGRTYDKKPDGSLVFKESIAQAEGGLTLDQALIPYVTWMGGSYPGFVREAYFQGSETRPEAMASAEKARPYIPSEVWGRFNFTEEESLWMSTAGRDIERYANEAEREFVNGTLPLSEWDTYVSRLEAMGLDQYMNIYEQAYERYEATLR